jgi:hypothetical protein
MFQQKNILLVYNVKVWFLYCSVLIAETDSNVSFTDIVKQLRN